MSLRIGSQPLLRIPPSCLESGDLSILRDFIDRLAQSVYCCRISMHDMAKQSRKTCPPAKRVLVVIPCSAAKREFPSRPIAAFERYDGPFYKVIRKAKRERRFNPLIRIVILSAKHGLIRGGVKIRSYDQRFDADTAVLRGPKVRSDLKRLIRTGKFSRVCVNLGRDYAAVIQEMPELHDAVWAEGSIGKRAALLKQWIQA